MAGAPDQTEVDRALDTPEAALLAHAVRLAAENAEAGELPFGALVVRAGVILGTGVNSERRDCDPTAHAEVAAIRDACRRLGTRQLAGAVVVSSCEPCAICHAVAASVGVARIVYAASKESIPDLGGAPAPHGDLLPRMQAALRATAPDQIVHAPAAGADEPFHRYLAARSDAGADSP